MFDVSSLMGVQKYVSGFFGCEFGILISIPRVGTPSKTAAKLLLATDNVANTKSLCILFVLKKIALSTNHDDLLLKCTLESSDLVLNFYHCLILVVQPTCFIF